MSARGGRQWCAVIAAVAVTACGTSQTRLADPMPAGRTEWTPVLLQAAQEAGAGRYGVADKILADFAVRYPASAEATEAMYWRALYKIDPSNQTGGPKDAGALLDGYLASSATMHRTEVQTLRRLASALDVRAAAAAPVKVDVAKPDDKARDEEILRLKDELSKATSELDRIKRRLALPTKP
ncbi:MAG: hypothetical protein H7247_18035 [Polaromonas sp.]|nr:hypothetical protein [Gemmatimonadaceae bacterium]